MNNNAIRFIGTALGCWLALGGCTTRFSMQDTPQRATTSDSGSDSPGATNRDTEDTGTLEADTESPVSTDSQDVTAPGSGSETTGTSETTETTATTETSEPMETTPTSETIDSESEASSDGLAIAHFTASAPTVDGQVELQWEEQQAYEIGILALGVVDSPADLWGTFRALWDDQALYLFVEVFDDAIRGLPASGNYWEADGVELYLDMLNNKGDVFDLLDYVIVYCLGCGAPAGTLPVAFSGWSLGMSSSAASYTVELRLPWSALGHTPSAGHTLGFDLMLNDNDDGVVRSGKRSWHTVDDWAQAIPSRFGDLRLDP